MKKAHWIALLVTIITGLTFAPIKAQSNPGIEELQGYFKNQKLLITYREGEVMYGTYYFIEVHYCPNGYYGLYGNTVKRTVLGNEQRSNWQEIGMWQIINQNGVNGIYYAANNGNQQFYPVYVLENGELYIREGVTIVNRGQAICQ